MKKVGGIYFTELTNIKGVNYENGFEECDPFLRKEEITLLKYIGDGMYEEFYTRLHLPFMASNWELHEGTGMSITSHINIWNDMPIEEWLHHLSGNCFDKKYRRYKNLSYNEYLKLFEKAIENPLFVRRVYDMDSYAKKSIGSQIDMADKLQEQILNYYNKRKKSLEEEYNKFKEKIIAEDLELAYGENVLFDFQKGMNRKLKKRYTEE